MFAPPLWRGALVLVLYHLAFFALALILWPVFLWRFLSSPRYRAGMLARTGRVAASALGKHVVWVHGVSVGEVKAARLLIENLQRDHPEVELVISATTLTGYTLAQEQHPDLRVIYYPIDFGLFPGRALDRVRPACVLLLELEVWPNFLQAAARRKVPVIVINGRISERSFRGYSFVRRLLPQFDWIDRFCVQNDVYRDRLLALGLRQDRIAVTGNMKYDTVSLRAEPEASADIRPWLSADGRSVIVCGSTHGSEDEWVAGMVQRIAERTGQPLRLVVTPRHPERTAAVLEDLRGVGVNGIRWSQCRGEMCVLADTDVVVVDVIGQLEAFYGACDIAFVGGSLVPHGGQNMIEPAAMGKAVVFGPHTVNFRKDVELLCGGEAAVQVGSVESLEAVLEDLVVNPARRTELGQRSVELIASNRGATERTQKLLEPYLVRET